MNTKNNKRKQESVRRIEKVFINYLQTRDLSKITVSDICKAAEINRSTFYANFLDVYDLADHVREKLEQEVALVYAEEIESKKNSNNYLKLFQHIYENQIFYRTYFKLGYDSDHPVTLYDTQLAKQFFNNRFVDYHITFFMHGLNAIIKKWLAGGCKESPEEMNEILETEYQGRV